MSGHNHAVDRELQRDARLWAKARGINYTTALAELQAPLAQGLLGPRLSVRALFEALKNHPLIGDHGGPPRVTSSGFAPTGSPLPTISTYTELSLLADFLRMFTPAPEGAEPTVSSYSLKHRAEDFLRPEHHYVSNGETIWVAAALGLPMSNDDGGINAAIGVSEREHDYLRRMLDRSLSGGTPRASHFRPPGLDAFIERRDQARAAVVLDCGWQRPSMVVEAPAFHMWLAAQEGRNDSVGDLAHDYLAGIRDSDHGMARDAGQLLDFLRELGADQSFRDAALRAGAECAAAGVCEARITPYALDFEYEDEAGQIYQDFECLCGSSMVVEAHASADGDDESRFVVLCRSCAARWRPVVDSGPGDWHWEPAAA